MSTVGLIRVRISICKIGFLFVHNEGFSDAALSGMRFGTSGAISALVAGDVAVNAEDVRF